MAEKREEKKLAKAVQEECIVVCVVCVCVCVWDLDGRLTADSPPAYDAALSRSTR